MPKDTTLSGMDLERSRNATFQGQEGTSRNLQMGSLAAEMECFLSLLSFHISGVEVENSVSKERDGSRMSESSFRTNR